MNRQAFFTFSLMLMCLQQAPVRAQSAQGPELSCFEGPEFFENSYNNWRFINTCPFEVVVSYEESNAVRPFIVGACATRIMQKLKKTEVRWLHATATVKGGKCLDGIAVGSNTPREFVPTGPKSFPLGKKLPDFNKLIADQESRSAADILAIRKAEKQAADHVREAEREAQRKAREAQDKRDAKVPKPASGFDVGKCDRVEYGDGSAGVGELLCWRKGYVIDNANPGAMCDQNGVMYNGVLALYCGMGN